MSPIPLGGGIAVWLATWFGAGIAWLTLSPGMVGTIGPPWHLMPLAIASFVVLVLGVVDDRYGMRGCHKLTGQIVAALVMIAAGLRIDGLSGFGCTVEFGVFSYPITLFWVVLVVNAFNLIDGMDGFCGGVGLVTTLALAFMAFWSGRVEDVLLGLALAGGLVAFLKDNLPPARIYLGDAGSMSLGMMVAVLSLRACSAGPGTPVALAPLLALLILPLLDVVTALARRWLTGHSLFIPDRGHVHHRLRNRLGGAAAASAAAFGLATVGACGAALARSFDLGDMVAVLAIATPVAILVGTDTFGASESRLLLFRLKRIGSRFLASGSTGAATIHQECRLHGGRDWARVWDALIGSVEAGEVRQIELSIDMPAAGETYHGLWSQPTPAAGLPNWSVIHSLHVGGVHAGELRVAGSIDLSRTRYLEKVENLVRILEEHLESDTLAPIPVPSGVTTHGRGLAVLHGTKF